MDITYVNLTPHDVIKIEDDGSKTRYKPSGKVAHLNERDAGVTPEGEPITDFGSLSYNPPVIPGILYIVPLATALVVHRDDFRYPANQTRHNGQVNGCRNLGRVAPWTVLSFSARCAEPHGATSDLGTPSTSGQTPSVPRTDTCGSPARTESSGQPGD